MKSVLCLTLFDSDNNKAQNYDEDSDWSNCSQNIDTHRNQSDSGIYVFFRMKNCEKVH